MLGRRLEALQARPGGHAFAQRVETHEALPVAMLRDHLLHRPCRRATASGTLACMGIRMHAWRHQDGYTSMSSPAVDADIRKRGRFRRSVGLRSCGVHLLPANTLLRSARHVNPRDYGTLCDAATQNTRLLERSVTLTHATPAAAPETDDPRRSPLKLGQDRSLE